MSDVSGIPYLGIPGMGGGPHFSTFGGSPGVSPAWSADVINASMGMGRGGVGDQSQALYNNLYGPMGFGGQTAMYSGIGAGYGRATGGFGMMPGGGPAPAGRVGTIGAPSGAGEAAPTPVSVDSSPFGVENAGPVPYLDSGGAPFGGGGFGGRGPSLSPLASYGGTGYDAFDPSIYGGSKGFGVPSISRRGMPSFGYDPSASAALPPGPPPSKFDPQSAIDAVNQFAGKGVEPAPMGGSGLGRLSGARLGPAFDSTAGSVPQNFPSKLGAFELGTSAVPYARMPTVFDTGAAPVPYQKMPTRFETGAAPVPFFGGAPPGGAQPAREPSRNVFESGAPSFFGSAPSLGFGVSAYPGAGVGSREATRNFAAPSSPFESGVSPVPFQFAGGQAFPVPGIGGYRGTMRDQVAAAMSGAGGMDEPAPYPSGPVQTGIPTPTQPQMSDAWRRIGAGPGSPGVSSVAQQVPPPPAPYARINQAIYDIGNVSQPDMFDNLRRPLGEMFSPSRYRGR